MTKKFEEITVQIWIKCQKRSRVLEIRETEQAKDLEERVGMAEGTRVRMVTEGKILDWTGLMKLVDDTTVEIIRGIARRRNGKEEEKTSKEFGSE